MRYAAFHRNAMDIPLPRSLTQFMIELLPGLNRKLIERMTMEYDCRQAGFQAAEDIGENLVSIAFDQLHWDVSSNLDRGVETGQPFRLIAPDQRSQPAAVRFVGQIEGGEVDADPLDDFRQRDVEHRAAAAELRLYDQLRVAGFENSSVAKSIAVLVRREQQTSARAGFDQGCCMEPKAFSQPTEREVEHPGSAHFVGLDQPLLQRRRNLITGCEHECPEAGRRGVGR